MNATALNQSTSDAKRDDPDQPMRDGTNDGMKKTEPRESNEASMTPAQSHVTTPIPQPISAPQNANDGSSTHPKQPWEYIDELLQLMKTGHPLLVLTIETMVDQILQRFKATAEEEIYRLVCMLLIDAIQVNSRPTSDLGCLINSFTEGLHVASTICR